MTQRGIELELPDLPEVPIRLGAPLGQGGPGRPRVPLAQRLREAFGTWLPLIMMAMLALGTWWLVKNSPGPLPVRDKPALRTEPDYAMEGFLVRRFDAQGEQKVRVEGRLMRHYADPTERVEIDDARVTARAPDGRTAVLTAQRATSDPKGEEVRLLGQARIASVTAQGEPLLVTGEAITLHGPTQRAESRAPVQIEVGASRLSAAAMDYDHLAHRLQLQGPLRGSFVRPPSASAAPAGPAAPASPRAEPPSR